MKKLRLKRPVVVSGKDVFGRRAYLVFEPTEEGGWWWRPNQSNLSKIIEVRWENAGHMVLPGLLYLKHGEVQMNIIEHILPMRFLGLDGVIFQGSRWPPYHGRVLEVLERLMEQVEETEKEMSWIEPAQSVKWSYSNGRQGFVEIVPHKHLSKPCLSVEVTVDYAGIGKETVCANFPDDLSMVEGIFSARAQGWPSWRYYLCLVASAFGWPHFRAITWPQRLSANEAINLFAWHRVADLLGGFSLTSPFDLPSARVVSYCAGHEAD